MLRFAFSAILILLISLPAFSQENKGQSKDEAAIVKVIENESKYFWGRKLEKWKKIICP